MSGQNDTGGLEYDVWGGYETQEYGEHYATFSTLLEAETYRQEMILRSSPGLWLSIRQKGHDPLNNDRVSAWSQGVCGYRLGLPCEAPRIWHLHGCPDSWEAGWRHERDRIDALRAEERKQAARDRVLDGD